MSRCVLTGVHCFVNFCATLVVSAVQCNGYWLEQDCTGGGGIGGGGGAFWAEHLFLSPLLLLPLLLLFKREKLPSYTYLFFFFCSGRPQGPIIIFLVSVNAAAAVAAAAQHCQPLALANTHSFTHSLTDWAISTGYNLSTLSPAIN